MKRFKSQQLDSNDYRGIVVMGTVMRVLLTPIFLIIRIYDWVWDHKCFQ